MKTKTKTYRRTKLTGGDKDALDGIDAAVLNIGDKCIVDDGKTRQEWVLVDWDQWEKTQ